VFPCSVYARVRPTSQETADWRFSDTSLSSARANSTKEYHLDGVFHASSTRQVYDRSTKHLIQPVLDGFSCTIFAYGQTASGKTHTMRGTTAEPGIIVHAVKDLFEGVVKSAHEQKREFCIRASYLEVFSCPVSFYQAQTRHLVHPVSTYLRSNLQIYNEEVNDLLDPGKRNLSIKADSEKGIMVAGLSESLVYNVEDVMRVFEKGDQHRRVGETKMNEASSRSHSIFRVVWFPRVICLLKG
jgi:centromeric protein E